MKLDAPMAPATTPDVSAGDRLACVGLGVLLANVILIGIDVIARWLFNIPQSWVADVAQLSYPIAIACCFPAALESGHMIAVRFLGEAIGQRTARALDTVGQMSLVPLLLVFAWKMAERAISDWSTGFKTPTLAWPVAPTWVAVTLLLLLSAWIQLRICLRALQRAS